jgi:hypothetical protein
VAQLGMVGFKLGAAVAAENAVPAYVRNEVAKKQKS